MVSASVTRRAISLGSRDSWSGWRAISFAETTIDMVILPQGSSMQIGPVWFYARNGALGVTADAVVRGDQIKDSVSNYWQVQWTDDRYWLDSFVARECLLVKLSMYQADFGTLAAEPWTKTRGSDPRHRGKVFLDTYLRAAQITKDDDNTTADFGVLFSDPPYDIDLEFRGSSNMEGLFVVDEPASTPLIDAMSNIYGYDEVLPLHVMAVNSTGCTGTALAHKMEAELRYVCENNAIGTSRVRNVVRRGKQDINLGGMTLYDTLFEISYKRGILV